MTQPDSADNPKSLTTPKLIANPHRRTRTDHATETAEDYVEAVDDLLAQAGQCRVSDLAKKFAVSHVTVHRIVNRLQSEGYLETEPYRPITLTKKGKKLAESSRHRHEIVLNFLIAIGVDKKTANIDAEGIEHHVSPQTLDKLARLTDQLTK